MSTRVREVAVTWELIGETEGSARVLVDVEAPLRPFGAMPTPPKGTTAALPTQKGHRLPPIGRDLLSDEGAPIV
jgi:hypothetical protein